MVHEDKKAADRTVVWSVAAKLAVARDRSLKAAADSMAKESALSDREKKISIAEKVADKQMEYARNSYTQAKLAHSQ